MLCKVQWSGFPIIANLFKGKLLHCEGASSRGGCRAQRVPGRACRAQAVMAAATPRAWLQAASKHMQRPLCPLTEGWRKDQVSLSPCSSVLVVGTQIARGSWARPGHGIIRSALVAGSYQRLLWPWGASHLCVSPQLCVPSSLGVFHGGEGEYHDTRLPRSSAAGNIQGPKRSQVSLHCHTCLAVPSHRDKWESVAISSCVL